MRSCEVLLILIPVGVMSGTTGQQATSQQAVIENTGSTNTAPFKVMVNPGGAAQIQVRDAEATRTTVDSQLSQRLFEDLKSVGSLNALPRVHCAKSVSFGTSLYLEFNGERSPDLNCPVPPDSKVEILKKDVQDIMQAAHASPHMARRFPATAHPAK